MKKIFKLLKLLIFIALLLIGFIFFKDTLLSSGGEAANSLAINVGQVWE